MKDKLYEQYSPFPDAFDFDSLDFKYGTQEGVQIINLAFDNLYIALRMSQDKFHELMQNCPYDVKEGWFKSRSPKGSIVNFIKKGSDHVVMQWLGDSSFCTHLKDQISDFFIQTDSGWHIYALREPYDPIYVVWLFLVHEGKKGSAYIKRVRT